MHIDIIFPVTLQSVLKRHTIDSGKKRKVRRYEKSSEPRKRGKVFKDEEVERKDEDELEGVVRVASIHEVEGKDEDEVIGVVGEGVIGGSVSSAERINNLRQQFINNGYMIISIDDIFSLFNIRLPTNTNTLLNREFNKINNESMENDLFLGKYIFDPYRQQVKICKDKNATGKECSQLIKKVIDSVVKLIYGCDFENENIDYYDIYGLKSFSFGPKQFMHTDYLESESTKVKELVNKRNAREDVECIFKYNLPIAVMIGLQNNTPLDYVNSDGNRDTLYYNKGDIIIFNSAFKHGGSYSENNTRIHMYISPYKRVFEETPEQKTELLYEIPEEGFKTELFLNKNSEGIRKKLLSELQYYQEQLEYVKTYNSKILTRDLKIKYTTLVSELQKIIHLYITFINNNDFTFDTYEIFENTLQTSFRS